MKSRVKFECVATVGKFKDKVTGEERKQFMRCGTVFESEDGRLSLKLDALPVSKEWSGFFALMPPKAHDGSGGQQRAANVPGPRTGHQNGAPPPPPVTDNHDDDEIPF